MILNRRIRTLLNDDQRFTDFEIGLLHTPAMQRLYDLHQLGYADRVFIDASHSRLHHVIGVVEQADKITRAIVRNLKKEGDKSFAFGDRSPQVKTARSLAALTRTRQSPVRLMAFLHDLTHAPYGHTLEDEIELVEEKHDQPHRQADAFYRVVIQYMAWIERDVTRNAWGVERSQKLVASDFENQLEWYLDAPDIHEIPDNAEFIAFAAKRWALLLADENDPKETLRRLSPRALETGLRHLHFAMAALFHLEVAHKDPKKVTAAQLPASSYPVLRLIEATLESAKAPLKAGERFDPNRDAYLLDIIGNTICADLLDYARRDATHAGLKLSYDADRIIANMTIVSTRVVQKDIETSAGLERYPFNNDSLRTAISIFSHKLRLDVPGELLNLLQVRFYVYERVLYHATKSVAGAMLGAAMQNIGWRTLPPHWRFVGDAVFVQEAREAARAIRDILATLTPQDEMFGSAQIDAINEKLAGFPDTGLTRAIAHWLDNRSKVKLVDLKERLKTMTRMSRNHLAASAMLEALRKSNMSEDVMAAQWRALRMHLLNAGNSTKSDASNIIELLFPTVARVRDEVSAGIRLIHRLAARRFYKVIFRLLPNASHANGDATGLTPDAIAAEFKKPITRRHTEWAIANRAGLPRGSVIIHCPPADGPKKIANILMTDGKSAAKPKLRDIGELDPNLFKHHEQAVTTQEQMYRSMWRLSVSVSPPYNADWARINPIIGRAIYSALGGTGELLNDEHMIRELEEQATSVEDAHLRDAAATRRHMTDEDDLSELANGVIDILKMSGAQVDGDLSDVLAELRERIGFKEEERDDRKPQGGDDDHPSLRRWTRQGAVEKDLNNRFGPIFTHSDRSRKLYRRIVRLSPKQQEWLDQRLSETEKPTNVEQNRVVTDNERDESHKSIEELVTQAENL